MPKKTEAPIQKEILEYLALRQAFHWRNNKGTMKVGRRYIKFGGLPGAPDIFALERGTFYGIEVKSEDGEQSSDQETFAKNFAAAGGVYILARSIRDVAEMMR